MKILRFVALLALAGIVTLSLLPSEALAAFAPTRILNLFVINKLLVGSVTEANAITKVFSASGTVDFASTSVGRVESSGITVTGAVAGDTCVVGTTTAAGALAAQYTCYVSAADTVKIVFNPLSHQRGSVVLDGGSPSQMDATGITASSNCTCAPVGATAAIAAAGCATSLTSTTLTVTGPNTVDTTVNYDCVAPVNPASGTFYVRVFSAQ